MKSSKLPGALLRMERTRQGLMLKQVCQGICVTSYLSKIEHGSAEADPALLEALFARLGIRYTADEETLAPLREKMAVYHEQYLYGMDREATYRELLAQDMLLTYSPLCVDWLIVRGLEQVDVRAQLDALEECMTAQQRAWKDMLHAYVDMKAPENLAQIRAAAGVLGSSSALLDVCVLAFYQNKYALIHRLEGRLTALALAEGNTYVLGCYYDFKGMAYSCLDQDEMMMDCYLRAIHLLQGTRWADRLENIYYNIGATYVATGKYEQALKYLALAENPDKSLLAVRHKQTLAYIRMGRMEEARQYLAMMKEELDKEKEKTLGAQLWYEEAQMECRDGFLEDPAYLALLERLFEAFEKEATFGYLYFYRDRYVQACTRQRQYKKALEFERKISSVIHDDGG